MKEKLSDKIKRIFKRIIAIGGAASTLLLPTACASEQQPTNENTENDKHASFVDDLREDFPTTQSELDKMGVIDDKITEPTTEFTEPTTENEMHDETTLPGPSTKPNNQQNNQEVDLYNKLLNQFNIEVNKKGFSDATYKYLKAAFDKTYENYDSWKQINKDLPSKEQYIRDNIISNIKNIKNIYLLPIESNEAQDKLNKGYGLGTTNNKFEIFLITDDSYESNFDKEVERLLHEIIHVGQKNIVFNKEYFSNYDYLKTIIIEGEATYKQKFMNEPTAEKLASKCISNGNYDLIYQNDNGQGYHKDLSIYSSLVFLAGYDAMERVSSGEQEINSIKVSIERRYGKQTADTIFSELVKQDKAEKNGDEKAQMEAATNFYKEVLKCIEKDIAKLKTKKDVIEYTNIYRAYKINVLPKISKGDVDHTNEYFGIAELDAQLSNKIIETEAFEFSTDNAKNKQAVRCLLFTSKDPLPGTNGTYVPINLEEVEYAFNNGNLTLKYNNKTEFNSENKETFVTMKFKNGQVCVEDILKTNNTQQNFKPVMPIQTIGTKEALSR